MPISPQAQRHTLIHAIRGTKSHVEDAAFRIFRTENDVSGNDN